jgi:hypothetical protein
MRGYARGWAHFYCIAQNDPGLYTRCYDLAVERGYSNIAPGRGRFILECMTGRRRS